MCILCYRSTYPLMFTNRSSAALWMWKTSSLNRQRQVELCRASFHKDNAAASLFSTAWHRMKPTGDKTERIMWLNEPALLWSSESLFQRYLQTIHFSIVSSDRYSHGILRQRQAKVVKFKIFPFAEALWLKTSMTDIILAIAVQSSSY